MLIDPNDSIDRTFDQPRTTGWPNETTHLLPLVVEHDKVKAKR